MTTSVLIIVIYLVYASIVFSSNISDVVFTLDYAVAKVIIFYLSLSQKRTAIISLR